MFSIVMPLWNKAEMVGSTAASVLAQDFGDFELIVVDDGSTDGSAEIVSALADPRIRIVRQANAGAGAARNAGIVAAEREWIAFIDGDDLWHAGHLAELDRIRRRFPEAGLIGTAYRLGRLDEAAPQEAGGDDRIERIDLFGSVGAGEDPLCTSSAALRREAWEAVGGFRDHRTGEDTLLWAQIAFEYPVAVSRRRTAVYRVGTGGLIDRSRRRWVGNPPRSLADISPAPALAAERYEAAATAAERRSLDMFIDRYVSWAVLASVAVGDVESVRVLAGFYRLKPRPKHRLLILIAALPVPLARMLYRSGLGAKALARRAAGWWR